MALSAMTKRFVKMRFGLTARTSIYERIAAFLEAGIPIFDTIESIRARLEKKGDIKNKMLAEWVEQMSTGMRFSDALREWIPPAEYMLISSGERGKGIVNGLKEATRLSSAAARIKSAIIGGAAMPAVLFVLLGVMLAGFDLFMAPVFTGLLPVSKWPDNAQTLYSMAHGLVKYWFFAVAIVAALVFVVSTTINRWRGPSRELFDRFPPWSIYKNYQASSFLIGLSSMLKAGVALNDSLKLIKENASPWLEGHLDQMLTSMKRGGENYGDALNTGLFDDDTAGDLSDYARLSSFENAIFTIGERMVEEGVTRTNTKMDLARNLMLVIVAGTVFWIYFTSYSLQTTIAEAVQSGRK